MQVAEPDPAADPWFFLKPPSTTVVGPTADVGILADGISRIDWEIELGVVIGRGGQNIDPQVAESHVAGYVVVNDISDRGRVKREQFVSPHFEYDWLGHKGQDGFCPVGPGMVPAFALPDVQTRAMTLSVNGVVKQRGFASDMVIDIAHLVAGASRQTTLEPGDLILTGTPAGVGAARAEFLEPGDVVEATIEGIGTLTNQIVERATVGSVAR